VAFPVSRKNRLEKLEKKQDVYWEKGNPRKKNPNVQTENYPYSSTMTGKGSGEKKCE